ncbi:hypothetical protein V5F29_05730 [Xanthobacter aminoxidans]|uniref:DUF6968 family protein n=1 Tax=Xanthobacter aminoxidans TaxID=186280 RepID=UPI0037288CAE
MPERPPNPPSPILGLTNMEIISHFLYLNTSNGEIPIAIRIYAPENTGPSWACRYEIDWPEGMQRMAAHGIDSLQALVMAQLMIGSEIYASSYHKDGALRAANRESGYGFPVPPFLRHLLVGRDAAIF